MPADDPSSSTAPTPIEETASEENISEEEAALLAQIENEAQLAEAEALPSEESDSEEGREIVYRVSRDGMRVLIGDAEFTPYAVAVRAGGGWGVRLTVEAKASAEMVLYAPKQGPLAFGGTVKKGSPEKFGDRREGGSEVMLAPGQPVSFSRTWPDPGEPGLKPGQELELHVGLWGLGTSSEDRRPVNRFAVVTMKAGPSGAQPVIQPPNK